jgi:hypothetical protein
MAFNCVYVANSTNLSSTWHLLYKIVSHQHREMIDDFLVLLLNSGEPDFSFCL